MVIYLQYSNISIVDLRMRATVISFRQLKNPVIAKQLQCVIATEEMKNELNKNIITIIYNNHDIVPCQRINSLFSNHHPNVPKVDNCVYPLSWKYIIIHLKFSVYVQPNIKPCGLFIFSPGSGSVHQN